ncbi:MAG: hypothetical protein IMF15_10050 [Proteobacteria bacterium]|nr:hypothetical protein [Pseudomonadota bacterium]
MSQTSSDNYANVPALKNVQTIVLLSELKQQAGLVQADQDKSEAVADKVENAAAEKAFENGADPESVSGSQVAAVPQDTAVEKPETTERAAIEAAVVVEQISPAKVLPTVSPTVAMAKSASCFTLGPFRNLDKLRVLTREIKSYVVATDFRGREEKEQTLYWVYIQPEKSRIKAIETGKRLKAKKIKDFYVIREGEKVNGLSLGHFRNKDGAYGLAKKVKNLGFDVMVEPVFKTYTIYWLDYELAEGVDIPQSIFEKHIKSSKKDKISRLSRDCN